MWLPTVDFESTASAVSPPRHRRVRRQRLCQKAAHRDNRISGVIVRLALIGPISLDTLKRLGPLNLDFALSDDGFCPESTSFRRCTRRFNFFLDALYGINWLLYPIRRVFR